MDFILENFELKEEKKNPAEDPFTFSHLEKLNYRS